LPGASVLFAKGLDSIKLSALAACFQARSSKTPSILMAVVILLAASCFLGMGAWLKATEVSNMPKHNALVLKHFMTILYWFAKTSFMA
jgi:hypothetical protein